MINKPKENEQQILAFPRDDIGNIHLQTAEFWVYNTLYVRLLGGTPERNFS